MKFRHNIQIQDLLCGICHEISTHITETSCGHIFCMMCVKRMTHEQKKKCPICRDEQINTGPSYMRSKFGQESTSSFLKCYIGRIKVKCANKPCKYVGTYSKYQSIHLPVCQYTTLHCPHKECDAIIHRWQMSEHKINCMYHKIICDSCNNLMPRGKWLYHTQLCGERKTKCKYCDYTDDVWKVHAHLKKIHYKLFSDIKFSIDIIDN